MPLWERKKGVEKKQANAKGGVPGNKKRSGNYEASNEGHSFFSFALSLKHVVIEDALSEE